MSNDKISQYAGFISKQVADKPEATPEVKIQVSDQEKSSDKPSSSTADHYANFISNQLKSD